MIQQTNLYFARYIEPKRGQDDIAVLTRKFAVKFRREIITVPKGFSTDGSSVPRFARAIVDRMTGIEAAVVHDYLYRTRTASKEFADDLFSAMLAENSKVSWMQRNLMVGAVRAFGNSSYYKTETAIVGQEDIDHG